MIEIGFVYRHADGELVQVTGLCKMKLPDDTWVDGVEYVEVKPMFIDILGRQNIVYDHTVYVRTVENFLNRFKLEPEGKNV